MDIIEIINKKRIGKSLSNDEIAYFIDNYVSGKIPDYQASALLMAICINGMKKAEIFSLCDTMIHSGDVLDLHNINGIKVDKHSTGGVSDTTTIALVPILASAGLKIAKMSGAGLGFTGGTLDKLSAFPNIELKKSVDEIIDIVNKSGGIIVSQTADLVPADKKLYKLRDITGTVQSIPLIATSVMSKKIASGSDLIFLDVKTGNGSFMNDKKDAIKLARTMMEIGKYYGRKVFAVISSMEQPLGSSIGCELELEDAINVLRGQKDDLSRMVKFLCVEIMQKSGLYTKIEAEQKFDLIINNGTAYEKLREIIVAQGGDFDNVVAELPELLPKYSILAQSSGYIAKIDAKEMGEIVCDMGGGRKNLNDDVDKKVGLRILKKVGESVSRGDVIVDVYAEKQIEEIKNRISRCFSISSKKVKKPKLIVKYLN